MNNNNLITARICDVRRESYTVLCEDEYYTARLKGCFYHEDVEFPTIGDYVNLKYNPSGDSIIESLQERTSAFVRPDNLGHADSYVKILSSQTLAANFDYAFIIVSLNKNFNINRIARYISVVLQGGGIPVAVLTKADLCENTEDYIKLVESLSDSVRVHAVSSYTGFGMEELKQYFTDGKTIALLGSSGVGKSTLVNYMAGEELMKVSAIREEDSRGRHTTTHRQLLILPTGTAVIDTPGIRELGMCDVAEGISDTFPDIDELISSCRFGNCRHESEPGCAVKAALESGVLSKERWEIYTKLMRESDSKRDKSITISRKRKILKKEKRR